MTLHPTRRLQDGRYILLGLLRTGGEAEVWRALDTVAGEQRALKVWLAADGGAEAAARELELARRVVHPHVVRVDDAFVDGDHAFVVMELAEGSLAERVATMGPLTPDEAFAALEGPLQALEAAHAAGIVHRDVKPHNLLVFGALDGAFTHAVPGALPGALERDGGGRPRAVVKLADFGIAQVRAEGLTRTRSGAFLGSLPFMSPEQRRDPRNVGPATDVYAAAVTLAWLVTGKAPGDLYLSETLAELRAELRGRGLEKREIERVVGVVEAGGRLEAGERLSGLETPRSGQYVQASRLSGTSRAWVGAGTAVLAIVATVAGAAWWPQPFAATPWAGGATTDEGSQLVRRSQDWAALPRCDGAPTTWEWQAAPRTSSAPPGGLEGGGGRLTDIDRDGFTDVLFQHSLGREFRVFWGNAEGLLNEHPTVVPATRMGSSANGSDAADLDRDGNVDLIGVATELMGFVVTRGLGGRRFREPEFIDSGEVPFVVHTADWNRDGFPDLLYLLMGDQHRLDWRPGERGALQFGAGRALVEDALAFDVADLDEVPGAELVVANENAVRVFEPLPDWRVEAPKETWALPLYNVTTVRVLPTRHGPRVYVGGVAPNGEPAALLFDGEGAACRMPLTGGSAFDFGYFNQDERPDYTHAESCGYCTTQYRVLIGTE